jgi:hypothetical protein
MGTAGMPTSGGPSGRAPDGPVPAQVVGGLGHVVGHHPGVGGLPGPAQGHVGPFASAAIGEQVGPGRGGTLAPVNACGVPVAQPVGPTSSPARRTWQPSSVRRTMEPLSGSTVSILARCEVTRAPAAPGASVTTRSYRHRLGTSVGNRENGLVLKTFSRSPFQINRRNPHPF